MYNMGISRSNRRTTRRKPRRTTKRRTYKRDYKYKTKSKTKSKKKSIKDKLFKMVDGHMVIDVPLAEDVHKLTKASKKHLYEGYNNIRNIIRFFNIILKKLPKKLLYFPTFPLVKKWGTSFDAKDVYIKMDNIMNKKGSKSELSQIDAIMEFMKASGFNDLDKEIDKGISKKYRYIAISLGLSPVGGGGHQNMVLFDTKNKVVELFEPHGGYGKSRGKWYHDVSYIIKIFTWAFFEDYKYISPKEFLPKGELQAKVRGPYCITWCMMYLHYKLLNKDIPTKTIIKRMTQIDTTFLMRYMKYIENTIKNKNKKYMKYKNTVKNKNKK